MTLEADLKEFGWTKVENVECLWRLSELASGVVNYHSLPWEPEPLAPGTLACRLGGPASRTDLSRAG